MQDKINGTQLNKWEKLRLFIYLLWKIIQSFAIKSMYTWVISSLEGEDLSQEFQVESGRPCHI